jgi:HK97 family phage portal protein
MGGSLFNQQVGITSEHGFQGYSRAYMRNEIVFACIEMLATSAGEPHIIGRRWRRSSPSFRAEIRAEENRLVSRGLPLRDVHAQMMSNGFYTDLPAHPLVRLLAKPNPWMSRGQLWGTVVMDRALAGNSYLLKVRVTDGIMKGSVAELWRLRPDRVRIIPDTKNFIGGYEYRVGSETVIFPPEDVIQFKTRHPLNDYYGMPPFMAAAGRADIDEYFETFLRDFFRKGGTGPGSILSVKQRLSQEQKDDIRTRFRNQFGGAGGYHEMMILDQAESTYQQMGLNRGLRDALPKELDAMTEARIAMVFGIPGSILGLLIGYESSSYANKRQDWQVFWDLTMTPLLSDLDDVLNLRLVPDFGMIDEVLFDLSDIRALQEDVDKLHERARKNLQIGGWSWQEFREATGKDPDVQTGFFFIPSSSIATPIEEMGKRAERLASPMPEGEPGAEPLEDFTGQTRRLMAPALPSPEVVDEVHCPTCGRWVGRNMNVGATAYCPKCKEVEVTA